MKYRGNFIYARPRQSTAWWIKFTLITLVVSIGTTFLIVTKITNDKYVDQIAGLNATIGEMGKKAIYYEEIERKYIEQEAQGIVLQSYEEKLQEKDKDYTRQINDLLMYNEELSVQSGALENTIKKFAYATGARPQNYTIPKLVNRGTYDSERGKLKYVGVWKGTYYSPNPAECSNARGITASGKPVEPGRNIAVDPKYWKLGTRFYIEGIGEVIATDTGRLIKGKNRFDYCILNGDLVKAGNFNLKVWVIEE